MDGKDEGREGQGEEREEELRPDEHSWTDGGMLECAAVRWGDAM